MTNTETPRTAEFCVRLNGKEYRVVVRTYPEGGGYNSGQTWVGLDEWHQVSPTYGHWWCLMASEHQSDSPNDFEAVRGMFRAKRSGMRRWANSRRELLYMAKMETGGKRGYYTREANKCMPMILRYAAEWKLCKQLWKEIAKL